MTKYVVRYISAAGTDNERELLWNCNTLESAKNFARQVNGKIQLNHFRTDDHWDIEAGIEQWREERDSD